MLILLVTIIVVYLRFSVKLDERKPPWPPNRKMGGVLTYEFGKIPGKEIVENI